MNDDTGQIVSLLTQRDAQREGLELQKIAVSRQKRIGRVYYIAVALVFIAFAYSAYGTFHH